jgi:DNA-directed RNA polymerase sigma subunit (sigma70/sigma32)
MLWSKTPCSLDEPLDDDDSAELGRVIEDTAAVSPQEAALTGSTAADVAALLGRLSPRARGIVRVRYGLDGGDCQTLEAVGRRFNLSRERIRQIEAAAMQVLRTLPEERSLLRLDPASLRSSDDGRRGVALKGARHSIRRAPTPPNSGHA